MYQITVNHTFSGAHCLRDYQGKCEQLHGHNFRVQAAISGRELDSLGMLVDFKKVKGWLQDILEQLDHRVLNDVPPFDTLNPTAENLSRYIHDKLSEHTRPLGLRVDSVGVWETERYCAYYMPDSQ